MSRFAIDIPKSKQTGKLTSKRWYREHIIYYLLFAMIVFGLLLMSIAEFNSFLTKNESATWSLILSFSLVVLNSFLIYSIVNMSSLKRINGLSRGKNFNLIKKVAHKNNWNISLTNQQLTIINLSKRDSGTYYGNQITILYDGEDILVNCITFGSFSTPSPFHWFTNKRKIDKLVTDFENGKKDALPQN